MQASAKPNCPDCGEYPVNHHIEWLSSFIDSVTEPFFAPLEVLSQKIWQLVGCPSFDKTALPFLRMLAFLRLGTIVNDKDNRMSVRAKLVWQAAQARNIRLWQFFALGRFDGFSVFVAQAPDGRVRAFEGIPRPRAAPPSLAWVDDKATLKRKFLAVGIPVARGRGCLTWNRAVATFNEVGAPVITKPNLGSRSRHTTVNIMNIPDLKKGFTSARRLSPWVMVEQELQGDLFRILLINGKVVNVLRRDAAHVVGDGTSSIRMLVEKENQNPRRRGPTFHPLPMDAAATAELSRQGYTWDSIPPRGVTVALSTTISRFFGGSTTDFTGRAHPDNLALFERIAEVLDDSLVGVDFIIRDIARSWREQELCGVVECNSLPNIQLHSDVLYGPSFDVAGMLFDLAFPAKGSA